MTLSENIKISSQSQELINAYWAKYDPQDQKMPAALSFAQFLEFIAALESELTNSAKKTKKQKGDMEFILVSLFAELLHDLNDSMPAGVAATTNREQETALLEVMRFIVFALASILVAACESLDSVVTIFGILALPAAVILATGMVFSFASMIIFCGFELIKISHDFGLNLSDSYQLLDVYLGQLQELKNLRKKIADYNLAEFSAADLQQLQQTLALLKARFSSLTEASKQFERSLNSTAMLVAKAVLSSIAALFYFGSGFCAGQSVSFFILGLCMTSITPASLPVILFSALVGLAAFGLHWYVEQPVLKKLISGLFGLSDESVAKLCDQEGLAKEEKKLESLANKVCSTAKLVKQAALRENAADDEKVERSTSPASVGNSRHAFMAVLPQSPPSPSPNPSRDHEGAEITSALSCSYL